MVSINKYPKFSDVVNSTNLLNIQNEISIILNQDLKIIFANKPFRSFSAGSTFDFSKRPKDLNHYLTFQEEKYDEHIRACLKKNSKNTFREVIAKNDANEDLSITLAMTTLVDEDNQPCGVFLSIEDKSNELLVFNKYKATIKGLEDTIKERTENLMIAKEEAVRANNATTSFLANMSHEMRTPLNGIIGFAELIVAAEDQEKCKDYTELIITESDNLLGLINQILDHTKMESGRFELEHLAFDLGSMLKILMTSMKVLAEKKGLEFDCKLEANVPLRLKGDPSRLRQILTNLIINAIKFTMNGHVHVKVQLIDEREKDVDLLFEVIDTGIGIPMDRIDDIFKSFVQADSSMTRNFGGTGLGTTISKKLVELFGGDIGVKSELHKGSTFWFQIPLEKRYCESTKKPEEELQIIEPIKERSGNILIVDDYETNRSIASNHLTQAGYTIDLATNGFQAIKRAQTKNYDLILMDVQMPVMDGLTATQKIRKLISEDIPIVGLTASVDAEKKCIQAGMNQVMVKPIRRKSLIKLADEWTSFHANNKHVKNNKMATHSDYHQLDRENIELNWGMILEDYDHEIELAQNIIKTFINDLKKTIDLLLQQFSSHDFTNLKETAHTIKGAAANMYAMPMSEKAKQLEQACDTQNVNDISLLTQQIEESYQLIENYSDKLLKEDCDHES